MQLEIYGKQNFIGLLIRKLKRNGFLMWNAYVPVV